uniref:hypothetical protein n=1 Tax=Sphingomonas prati TaxID=1843237 RepID=UPI001E47B5AE
MPRNKPLDGRISFAQRERARRGQRAVACDVSARRRGRLYQMNERQVFGRGIARVNGRDWV